MLAETRLAGLTLEAFVTSKRGPLRMRLEAWETAGQDCWGQGCSELETEMEIETAFREGRGETRDHTKYNSSDEMSCSKMEGESG